jgi:hypothetical protein
VLAEEGNPELGPAERARWLTHCDVEIDNFRSALDWLFQTLDLDWGVRLCVALFRFWDMREHLSEGRARIETVLRLCGEERTRERARLWLFLGALTPIAYYLASRFPLRRETAGRTLAVHAVGSLLLCVGWASAGFALQYALGWFGPNVSLGRLLLAHL